MHTKEAEIRDSDYDNDQAGHLIYWDCITGFHQILEPVKPIPDQNLVIGKIGQQNPLPSHFSLKPKDLEYTTITDEQGSYLGIVPPGISAFIFFGTYHCGQDSLESISKNYRGGSAHYKNRLYIAQVRDITEAGWTAIYAPLINKQYPVYNPLHVQIVPNSLIAAGGIADAEEVEKTALARVFTRWYMI